MDTLSIHDCRYIKTKIRTYGDKVYTNFLCLNVPEDGVECDSFTTISIDSICVYGKEYYLQVSTFSQLCLVVYKLMLLKHYGPTKLYKKVDKIYKNFKLYQVFIYNPLPKNVSIQPNHILPTKSIFITSQFYQYKLFPYFPSFSKHQSRHFVGCHATGINSLLTSFSNALRFLSLFCHTKKLTWIIISGSFSSN